MMPSGNACSGDKQLGALSTIGKMSVITVKFDIAVETTDGSYLGIYSTNYPIVSGYSNKTNGIIHEFDMLVPYGDVNFDGSQGSQRGSNGIGYLTIYKDAVNQGSYPIERLLWKVNTNPPNSTVRMRIITGTDFSPALV